MRSDPKGPKIEVEFPLPPTWVPLRVSVRCRNNNANWTGFVDIILGGAGIFLFSTGGIDSSVRVSEEGTSLQGSFSLVHSIVDDAFVCEITLESLREVAWLNPDIDHYLHVQWSQRVRIDWVGDPLTTRREAPSDDR